MELLITQVQLEHHRYIFLPDLTSRFNGLCKDTFQTRRETFKCCDLMRLVLEVWWHFSSDPEINTANDAFIFYCFTISCSTLGLIDTCPQYSSRRLSDGYQHSHKKCALSYCRWLTPIFTESCLWYKLSDVTHKTKHGAVFVIRWNKPLSLF